MRNRNDIGLVNDQQILDRIDEDARRSNGIGPRPDREAVRRTRTKDAKRIAAQYRDPVAYWTGSTARVRRGTAA